MSLLQPIKDHPWIAGGVVGFVLLLLLLRGSSAPSATPVAMTSDPTADQVTTAQLQASTAVAGYQAAAQHDATVAQSNLDLATIQSSTVDFANQLAAEVALSQIGAGADVANNQIDMQRDTTLSQISASRDTTLSQISASRDINSLNITTAGTINMATIAASRDTNIATINASVANQQTLADALTANAHESAETQRLQISTAGTVATTNATLAAFNNSQAIASNQAIQSQSWLSKIFG